MVGPNDQLPLRVGNLMYSFLINDLIDIFSVVLLFFFFFQF